MSLRKRFLFKFVLISRYLTYMGDGAVFTCILSLSVKDVEYRIPTMVMDATDMD